MPVFVGTISVAEAARRLGVGVPRIHQRIADGSLRAERIGSQWVIDEALLPSVLEPSRAGRPSGMTSPMPLTLPQRAPIAGVIGSRWAVDDAGTAVFMFHFFFAPGRRSPGMP